VQPAKNVGHVVQTFLGTAQLPPVGYTTAAFKSFQVQLITRLSRPTFSDHPLRIALFIDNYDFIATCVQYLQLNNFNSLSVIFHPLQFLSVIFQSCIFLSCKFSRPVRSTVRWKCEILLPLMANATEYYTNRPSYIQKWNRVSGSRVTGLPGQRFWPGRVGSRVSVSDPVFDPVLSFSMRAYRGVVSTE